MAVKNSLQRHASYAVSSPPCIHSILCTVLGRARRAIPARKKSYGRAGLLSRPLEIYLLPPSSSSPPHSLPSPPLLPPSHLEFLAGGGREGGVEKGPPGREGERENEGKEGRVGGWKLSLRPKARKRPAEVRGARRKRGEGGERKTNLSDGNGIKGTPGALAINDPLPLLSLLRKATEVVFARWLRGGKGRDDFVAASRNSISRPVVSSRNASQKNIITQRPPDVSDAAAVRPRRNAQLGEEYSAAICNEIPSLRFAQGEGGSTEHVEDLRTKPIHPRCSESKTFTEACHISQEAIQERRRDFPGIKSGWNLGGNSRNSE